MLATKKLNRSKHSGVLAAFRQYFVKTQIVPSELNDIYARVMEDRHVGDYELLSDISMEDARLDIEQTQEILDVINAWFKKEDWL